MKDLDPEKPVIPRGGYRKELPKRLALRNTLNLLFMIAALAAMIIYIALPMAQYSAWFIGIGMVAVILKIAEVVIRYMS